MAKIGTITAPPFWMCSQSVSSVASILWALPSVGSKGNSPEPVATSVSAMAASSGVAKASTVGSWSPTRSAVPTTVPSSERNSAEAPTITKAPCFTRPSVSAAVPSKRSPPSTASSRSRALPTTAICAA